MYSYFKFKKINGDLILICDKPSMRQGQIRFRLQKKCN